MTGLEGIRLVALTGYGQESDDGKSRAAGFHQHLVKPIEWRQIEDVLRGLGDTDGVDVRRVSRSCA
jgi:hypothetical protein